MNRYIVTDDGTVVDRWHAEAGFELVAGPRPDIALLRPLRVIAAAIARLRRHRDHHHHPEGPHPMTGSPALPMMPEVAANVLADVDAYLNPRDVTAGAMVANTAAPYSVAGDHPEAAALDRALEHVTPLLGALGEGLHTLKARAIAEADDQARRIAYQRSSIDALDEDRHRSRLLLVDAHHALRTIGLAHGAAVVDLATVTAERDALGEYLTLCHATDRMPTPSRSAAVIREARKRAAADLAAATELAADPTRGVKP